MALESELVRKVHKYCAQNNLFRINIMSANISGLPDQLIVTKEGRHIWVELKREDRTGRLSDIQLYRHAEMKGFSMEVYTIDSLDQLKEIINGKETN